jgi:CobQ-like glutamine amidotransferase family enzyme
VDLRLAHLYPDLLNLYGDRGNVLVLQSRALRRGISVQVLPVRLGDPLPDADLYFLGGGEDRQQALVAPALEGLRPRLEAAVRSGAVVLGVCGGYQLLGHAYHAADGSTLRGVGLLDVVTRHPGHRAPRLVGNASVACALQGVGTLVGFENHGGRTWLGPNARPLGRVLAGFGNNGQDRTEGAWAGTVFGTYLHGPLLPKNPAFADSLLRLALRRRFGGVHLAPLDDRWEHAAHARAAERAGLRLRGR